MIEVSELAARVLLESLQASGIDRDRGLRLEQEDGQFVLRVDRPEEDDLVVCHDEAVVLIVDRQLESEIGSALIDVEEGAGGAGLTIRGTWRN